MTEDVRYQPGGDNAVLRHVLCEVWTLQCYWCREFKKYLELQIDHIVPQKGSSEERERLQQAFLLDADYDVNAVENLAPICGPCNQAKTNSDLSGYPVVITHLKKARRRASRVRIAYREFSAASDLAGALLRAAHANLDDTDVRAAFEVAAPAVVQRLSELGPGKADYLIHEQFEVEGQHESHDVSLSLDEHGRTALFVFRDVAGGELAESLAEPVRDIFRQSTKELVGAFEAREDRVSEPSVGSLEIEFPVLVIDKMTCAARPAAELEFEFQGSLDGYATASIAWASDDGSDLEDAQGDATFSLRFTFNLSWEPTEGAGEFFFDQAWLEDFESETLIDGEREPDAILWPEDEDDVAADDLTEDD